MADVGSTDYQEMYLRPIQRELAVFEGERMAQAVVTRWNALDGSTIKPDKTMSKKRQA
ncbi:MAG: hypothetical protein ABSA51_01880 [Anaerolineaceae bacterium]